MPTRNRLNRPARLAGLLLNTLWWVMIASFTVAIALLIFWPLATRQRLMPTPSIDVTIENQAVQPLVEQFKQPTASSPVAVTGVDDVKAKVDLVAHKWWIGVVNWSLELPALAAAFYGLYLLRRFLKDVIDDRVFTPANARRLSLLGWLLVCAGVVLPLLEFARSVFLLKLATADMSMIPGRIGISSQGMLFPGLLVLVLAAAWRHGAELQTENDLTV